MSRPRVVIDTNVLISAALKPAGQQALVIQLVAVGAVEMCVSEELLAEYTEVFSRRTFSALDSRDVGHLLTLIREAATIVRPAVRLNVSKHDSDNRFYECAD